MHIDFQPSIRLKEAIDQRRAARAFRSDPIPEAILEEVLRLALRSPSGYNLQPWRFIVLKTAESKAKLRACAFDQAQITQAPVVLICCGDRAVKDAAYIDSVIQLGIKHQAINETYAESIREKVTTLFATQPSFESVEAWVNRHTMLAVAYLMIAAKSFGVDSCPMEGFVTSEVKAAFQIPDTVDVCCLVCLGYAMEPFKRFGGRFSEAQVCYSETYGQELSL